MASLRDKFNSFNSASTRIAKKAAGLAFAGWLAAGAAFSGAQGYLDAKEKGSDGNFARNFGAFTRQNAINYTRGTWDFADGLLNGSSSVSPKGHYLIPEDPQPKVSTMDSTGCVISSP
ncbi:MAG: hypothetical protein K9G62_02825 [Alphaproteobacteria bacterium]|nr:hypothetical protein [Alphaproteobacteria bacterium]